MFVDADAHADENPDTWSYIPEALADLRPAEMDFVPAQIPPYLGPTGRNTGRPARGLFIEGQLFSRRNRSDEQTQTTVEIRELRDIPSRLKHMDELGTEIQVIYPSNLLNEVTQRPEVEIAICESYNRWMADRCSEGEGRLKWMAVLPLLSIADATKELHRVKEAGAVGILKRGFESGERRAGSTYFHPIYELAQDLDLPMCIHSGLPYSGFADIFTKTKQHIRNIFYVQDAFLSLLMSGTCAKFPRLRFGFIEAASSWLPYILYTSNYSESHRTQGQDVTSNPLDQSAVSISHYEEILHDARMFVACEAGENLPVIIDQVGDNNLVVGTDYGHADRSAILNGHRIICEREDLKQNSAIKITDTNGRLLYGLAPTAGS